MRVRGRGSSFWVQVGIVAFVWGVTFVAAGWFAWSARWLYRYGDAWRPAVVMGVTVTAVLAALAGIITWVFVALAKGKDGPRSDSGLDPLERQLLQPVLTGWRSRTWAFAAVLAALVGWAGLCWAWQVWHGLGVTGLGRPVFWALYIVNFDFFLGIAYGLVLLSAVLRLAGADWRRAAQRLAALGALYAMVVGPFNILLDLGRLDHLHKVYAWGRMQSPLLWDVCSIMTFLFACIIYLYLPLIPDLGILRDHVRGWRRPIYHLLAFGWTGSPEQVRALDEVHRAMAALVVFIAVVVRSVVAWITSLTLQPLWHTSLSGPVYVVGAIFVSAAALVLMLASVRKAFGLQEIIKPIHFEKLGVVVLVSAAAWGYLLISELLTVSYGNESHEMSIIAAKMSGRYAGIYWTSVAGCFVFPVLLLARRSWRTLPRVVAASIAAVVGSWAQLYTELVPVLERPRMPLPGSGYYAPTFVELSLFAGCIAGFVLVTMVFSRFVPVVSIFYERLGRNTGPAEAAERVREYYPEVIPS